VPGKDAVLHGVRLLFQSCTVFLLGRMGFDGTVEFDLPERDVAIRRVFVYVRIRGIFGG
jgi:hypothetical protein